MPSCAGSRCRAGLQRRPWPPSCGAGRSTRTGGSCGCAGPPAAGAGTHDDEDDADVGQWRDDGAEHLLGERQRRRLGLLDPYELRLGRLTARSGRGGGASGVGLLGGVVDLVIELLEDAVRLAEPALLQAGHLLLHGGLVLGQVAGEAGDLGADDRADAAEDAQRSRTATMTEGTRPSLAFRSRLTTGPRTKLSTRPARGGRTPRARSRAPRRGRRRPRGSGGRAGRDEGRRHLRGRTRGYGIVGWHGAWAPRRGAVFGAIRLRPGNATCVARGSSGLHAPIPADAPGVGSRRHRSGQAGAGSKGVAGDVQHQRLSPAKETPPGFWPGGVRRVSAVRADGSISR